MKIDAFLKQPFDYLNTTEAKWLYILGSSGFAVTFLLLFQPYGISEEMTNPINSLLNKFLFFLSIAVSTILALALSQLFLRQHLGFDNVSNKRYTVWFLVEALLLLLMNFGLSFIIPDLGDDFEEELNLAFQVKIYLKILLILIFPFIGTVIYVSICRLNSEIQDLDFRLKAQRQKNEEVEHQQMLSILDENENLNFKIQIKNFLFAEASNQYILVHYIKNNEVRKHIIRNRLKKFLVQSNGFSIRQCHRSYAINLQNVEYLAKKNGKEFLIVKTTNNIFNIPVSSSYLDQIKKELFHD